MSRFHAHYYELYRPLYPETVFAGLPAAPARALDLGGGTGQSAESLRAARTPAELHVLDPDPAMLDRARNRPALRDAVFHVAPAEAVPLADASIDLVTIASAYHWMDRPRAAAECARVLRGGGHLLVFEYQFPKGAELPALNEWVRRQFNLLWKAPAQVPRGDFREITAPLRAGPWRLLTEDRPPMRLELGAPELHGLILSQSRYLHYERGLTEAGVAEERARIRRALDTHLPAPAVFDFALSRALFERA